MYVKNDFLYFQFIWGKYGEILYIRSGLRQLHLIYHKFSTELGPLIYGLSLN